VTNLPLFRPLIYLADKKDVYAGQPYSCRLGSGLYDILIICHCIPRKCVSE
jgi:hypothetical protein